LGWILDDFFKKPSLFCEILQSAPISCVLHCLVRAIECHCLPSSVTSCLGDNVSFAADNANVKITLAGSTGH
jgi:hypothetical protein